jgi:hypothetical protein
MATLHFNHPIKSLIYLYKHNLTDIRSRIPENILSNLEVARERAYRERTISAEHMYRFEIIQDATSDAKFLQNGSLILYCGPGELNAFIQHCIALSHETPIKLFWKGECPICMDTCKNPLFMECGHGHCLQCRTHITHCSLCRALI